jgi:hypothetical protein
VPLTARNCIIDDSTSPEVSGDHRRNHERLFAGSMALFVTLVVLTNTVGV